MNVVLVETLTSLDPYEEKCVSRAQEHINEEEQKVFLVVVSHTVVNPRAVVVHTSHTTLADTAVVALRGLYCLALLTFLGEYLFEGPYLLWSYLFL